MAVSSGRKRQAVSPRSTGRLFRFGRGKDAPQSFVQDASTEEAEAPLMPMMGLKNERLLDISGSFSEGMDFKGAQADDRNMRRQSEH